MVDTRKFSEFVNGGDLENNETTVGLAGGTNTRFNNPWTFLAPGPTGSRPVPAAAMYYRLRLNTTLEVYEYYDPTTLTWTQLSGSGTGTVNPGVANDLAFYAANGTAISAIAGAVSSVLVTNGSKVPSLSTTLPTGITIPSAIITSSTATLTAGSVVAAPVAGIDIANKTYVDAQVAATVVTITGTTNQVIASSPTGNVTLSLPQDIALGSTPTFGGLTLTNVPLGVSSGGTQTTSIGANGTIAQSNGTTYTFTTATYPSAATSTGTVLRANGTNWVASTSTFADTYAASTLLYSNGANTVTGLATANSAVLVTNSTGVPAYSSTMTDGQVIIGSTGATPAAATLTAGSGVTITNGAGSITINATGSAMSWTTVAGTSQAAAVNNGYITGNAAQTTVTLPATAPIGSTVAVEALGAGGWVLTANTGQTIKIGTTTTSTAGTLTSVAASDNVYVTCIVADTTWRVRTTNSTGLTVA